MTDSALDQADAPEPGQVVYAEDGTVLGIVRSVTEGGIDVRLADAPGESQGAAAPGDAEVPPGQSFGEGYLVWRCGDCGEMGELEAGMPESCSNCGAPKTALYRAEED